jgi:UDP-2,4-diacetamido-2,4,6-trideoxy-beta-L-altropyranose hydrolase
VPQPGIQLVTIAIRADSSYTIGTGHVMRCLALAQALRELDMRVEFICRDLPGSICHIVQAQGFVVHTLAADGARSGDEPSPETSGSPHEHWLPVRWQLDAEQTVQVLAPMSVDWLVIDHYALDARWELQVGQCARHILVIDDLADRNHHCDVLLDQNVPLVPASDYRHRVPAHAKQLLGPSYCLFRSEFALEYSDARLAQDQRMRLLVFMGGADANDYTTTLLRALQGSRAYQVIVVVGAANARLEAIRSVCQRLGCELLVGVKNMAQLIASVDLAIVASGFSAYEMAAMRVPALLLPLSEIQKRVASSLHNMGVGRVLDIDRLSCGSYIAAELESLRAMSGGDFAAFSRTGARRVAEHLLGTR